MKLKISKYTLFLVNFYLSVCILNLLIEKVISQEYEHSYLLTKNICKQESIVTYDKSYNIIKIKCDWNNFVDAVLTDPGFKYKVEEAKINKKAKNVYEIEFLPSTIPSDKAQYKTIDENLFNNFKLKSVSFRNLGLTSVNLKTFSESCCKSSLETLDLSGNKLRRIDREALANLNRLETINLANNELSFSEQNFKSNYNLKKIDISSNNLQYLPSNLFHNINELKELILSDNNLKSIDACILHKIQTSILNLQYNPAIVHLINNPIDCGCDIFFLNRHLGYKLNLTCSSPEFYYGKSFNQLDKEDPSARCDYKKMSEKCNNEKSSNGSLVCAVIVLSVISALLFLILCCCCNSNMSLKTKVTRLREHILHSKQPTKPKPIYVNSGTIKNLVNNDKEKLIET